MEKEINLKKILIATVIIYFGIMILFYWVAKDQIKYSTTENRIWFDKTEEDTGDILDNIVIKQSIVVGHDILTDISVKSNTRQRVNQGNLKLIIQDKQSGQELIKKIIPLEFFPNDAYLNILYPNTIENMKNKEIELIITSDVTNSSNAIGLLKSINETLPNTIYTKNGVISSGSLNLSVNGLTQKPWAKYYWLIVFIIGVLIYLLGYLQIFLDKRGKKSLIIYLINEGIHYKFLLDQLVARDFKTKYKRSVLGVLWSFLNPLLTMSVQYVVFSTLFRSDIPNFQVYLLSGIILFNFFSEATGLGISSIVGNASLINKVYVPKYMYPISRVFSSVINLGFSLIPLVMVILLSRVPITKACISIIFVLICLIIFTIGMVLVLASMMVFFRDTQFLWSVVIMLWNYATPIFYPASIIPEKYSIILTLNPIYHFVNFTRTCILEGISPQPINYLICLIFAIGMLIIGGLIFNKTQDKFILNL